MTSMTPKTYLAVLYARRHFVDIVQPDEPDPPAAEQIKEMKAFVKELPDVKVSACLYGWAAAPFRRATTAVLQYDA